MAPKLNWSTELREIILKDALESYRKYARDEKEDYGLRKLSEEDFLSLPESIKNSDDEIAREIYEELKNQIIYLFEKAFKKFEETKSRLFKTRIGDYFKGYLNSIDNLFDKLILNEISENDFEKEYEDRYRRWLNKFIMEDYEELFKSYPDGCYFLFNWLKNPSLNLAGYLSIYYAFRSILGNLWDERGYNYFIRFNKHAGKIGGKPIQLQFCNFILWSIDFFSNDYSYLDILENSDLLKLDKDDEVIFYEIREHIRTTKEQLPDDVISHMIARIRDKHDKEDFFRERRSLLVSFLKQFISTMRKMYSTQPDDISVGELKELYNLLVVQNGIPEYEIFRIAANFGHACLPKISVIINEEDDYKEKEIDLVIIEDNKLHLFEVTFRKNTEECREKLNSIANKLEESLPGYQLEKHIITKDNFRNYVNRLSNGLYLPTS
jgi:hypothetical protein